MKRYLIFLVLAIAALHQIESSVIRPEPLTDKTLVGAVVKTKIANAAIKSGAAFHAKKQAVASIIAAPFILAKSAAKTGALKAKKAALGIVAKKAAIKSKIAAAAAVKTAAVSAAIVKTKAAIAAKAALVSKAAFGLQAGIGAKQAIQHALTVKPSAEHEQGVGEKIVKSVVSGVIKGLV